MAEPQKKKMKMAEAFRNGGVSDYIHKLNGIPQAAKEVFLVELVRNAADALHIIRLKTMYQYQEGDGDEKKLFIDIIPDQSHRTLSIVDNGVGMSADVVLEKLITVPELALKFYLKVADQLVENKVTANQFYTPDSDLFGGSSDDDEDEEDDEEVVEKDLKADNLSLGFFAAFMVADRVDITTKHCGALPCSISISGGRSGFSCDFRSSAHATFDNKSRCPRGTTVTLHLKQDHFDYLDVSKLKALIDKYPFQLCPYPICIRGVLPSGKQIEVPRRPPDVEEEKVDIKSFEGVRKLFEDVLVGSFPFLKQVVLSDRFYDLPAFLTPDRKTLKINPRNWIIKKIKELEPADRKQAHGVIRLQYVVSNSCLNAYEQGIDPACEMWIMRRGESFC